MALLECSVNQCWLFVSGWALKAGMSVSRKHALLLLTRLHEPQQPKGHSSGIVLHSSAAFAATPDATILELSRDVTVTSNSHII